jgi:2'-5' RNA ligase
VKRIFLAVDLDDHCRTYATRVIADLRARIERDRRMAKAKISWVPADNLHVTLHFLGGLSDERLARTVDVLTHPLPLDPFVMTPGEVGAFPANGPPRVIWIGFRDGGEGLGALHDLVGKRLQGAGHLIESRPFHAHITMARVRDRIQSPARILTALDSGAGPAALVDHVTLYESHASPHGSRYDALVRTPLVTP